MRLFIGIEFQESISDRLNSLQNELRKRVRSGRFPARGNLHLTLQFLGETSETRIGDIVDSLDAVSKRQQPFTLSFSDKLGYFGQRNPVRVAWLGMQGDLPALLRLQKEIVSKMQCLGFAKEDRAYHPHVTIAREADFINDGVLLKNGWIEFAVATFPVIRVEQFSLIWSVMGQGKLVYRTMETFKLQRDI